MIKSIITMPINTSPGINRSLVWSVGLYIILVFNFLEPFAITVRSFIPEYHLMLSTYGIISSLAMAIFVYFIHPQVTKYWLKSSKINAIVWFFIAAMFISLVNWIYSVILHDLLNCLLYTSPSPRD